MDNLDYYVQLAANGDRAAFEELYRRTYYSVYFTCYSFLKNEQDAADITQDVYVTVMNSLHTLEDKSKFIPWLNRIAVNKCKNYLKLNKPILMDMETMDNPPLEENENFLPEDYITNQTKRQIVMEIMRTKLTDAQYQTVIMFYFNGLSVQEIADIMECPVGTVTYRLSVARGKIKQGVLEYENINEDKLYSYGTIPLLASLLTAEVTGLTNMYAQASNVIAPASTSSIAVETAKIGVKDGMFKTLKAKIIAGIAGVAVVGGIAGVVILSNKNDAKQDDAKPDNTTEIVQTEEIEDETEEIIENSIPNEQTTFSGDWEKEEESGYSPFWIKYADLTSLENKNLDDLMCYEKFKVSDNIADILSLYNHFVINDGISNIATVESYEELLAFSGEIHSGAPLIQPFGYSYDKVTIFAYENADETGHRIEVVLYNLTDEEVSVKQCIENNEYQIFNDNGAFLDEILLNRIIEKEDFRTDMTEVASILGSPTGLYASLNMNLNTDREGNDETIEETIELGGGSLVYSLLYDKDDYIIKVECSEANYYGSYEGYATMVIYTRNVYDMLQESRHPVVNVEKEFAIE